MAKKISPQLLDLTEEIGGFIEYWGFKRIHGKIWAYLYLADRELAAADFMEAFSISKALASISIRDLMEYDVILEGERSSYGTQLYRPNPEIFTVITEVLRRRELKMLAKIESTHQLLADAPKRSLEADSINEKRLQQMGEMISLARTSLGSILNAETMDLGTWKEFNGK